MWPDINGFFAMVYGTGGVDLGALTVWQFGNATGVVFSGNPPYTATDFLMGGILAGPGFPKFFGTPTILSGVAITAGSSVITGVSDALMNGLAIGQLVVNLASVPKDSVITAVGTNEITISNNATANDTQLAVYTAPPMPLVSLLWFVYLAGASVSQQRYVERWPFAMGLFIAHFATMWMSTEEYGPNSTPMQIVTAGLERGLLVAKSAGDVSASMSLLTGYEEWGSFATTRYGRQFIDMARATCAGPIWVQ